MRQTEQFYGVGVGPGEPGLIPVAAWEAIHDCDHILVPRAKSMSLSIARRCLPESNIPEERFEEIEFTMDPQRSRMEEHYRDLATSITERLRNGKRVAYLTLGDPLSYSTYNYLLSAVRRELPDLRYRTFPGIPSYCAVAAATDRSLGEGKESVLILPCPDQPDAVRAAIEQHDVVILMKIGNRLPQILGLVKELGIESNCVLGSRVGMPEEVIFNGLEGERPPDSMGYLATMLIRKQSPKEKSS